MEYDFNYFLNVYCHNCGKVCSNYKTMKKESEWKVIILEWLECPYCMDCLKKRLEKRNEVDK